MQRVSTCCSHLALRFVLLSLSALAMSIKFSGWGGGPLVASGVNPLFPFILKYVDTAGLFEIGLVRQLYGYENEYYRNSWYLLKFMQANASPALKTIIEGELRIVENPEARR